MKPARFYADLAAQRSGARLRTPTGLNRRSVVETGPSVVREYAQAAERYFGAEQGRAWVEQVTRMFPRMARLAVTPNWVAILDFEHRFPSAIEQAMSSRAESVGDR